MSTKLIEITSELSYISLDGAIQVLEKMRNQYGGDAFIDIELEPVRYEDAYRAAVNLYVEE